MKVEFFWTTSPFILDDIKPTCSMAYKNKTSLPMYNRNKQLQCIYICVNITICKLHRVQQNIHIIYKFKNLQPLGKNSHK